MLRHRCQSSRVLITVSTTSNRMNLEHQEEILSVATDYFTVIERLEAKLNDNLEEDANANDRRKMDILVRMREHLAFRSKAAVQCVQNPSVGLAGMLQDRKGLIDGVAKLLQHFSYILNVQIWSSHIRHVESKYGSGFGSYFRFHRSMIKLNVLIFIPLLVFVILPPFIHQLNEDESPSFDFEFEPLNILNGAWNISLMYYGSYQHFDAGSFSMKHSFFITTFIIYLFILIDITVRMAKQYSHNFIQAQASMPYEFCYQIYAGWDFAIGAKYVKNKHASIRTQLKILMDKVETLKSNPIATKWPLIINGLAWIWVLGVIIGVGFLIHWVFHLVHLDNLTKSTIVTGVTFMVPQAFKFLDTIIIILDADSAQFGSAADRQRSRMYQTFVKIVFLEMAVLIVILVFYYDLENSITSSSCIEDSLGQEMYRLILMYFFFMVVAHFILESFYKLTFSTLLNALAPPEFDVAISAMYLLYAQTLVWIAIYYSPILIVFFILILFINFYCKLASLELNCSAAVKLHPWRAAQSQTLFFSMTFVNFLLVFVHFLFVINAPASQDCGPFQQVESPSNLIANVIILQPGFAGLILVTSLVILYYLVTQRAARRSRARLLEERLQKTRLENETLQMGISKAKGVRMRMVLSASRKQSFKRNDEREE